MAMTQADNKSNTPSNVVTSGKWVYSTSVEWFETDGPKINKQHHLQVESVLLQGLSDTEGQSAAEATAKDDV